MCGYHIINRVTNDANYIAMASTLTLPESCDWDSQPYSPHNNRGVYPEFFHSFHSRGDRYTLDIGLLYADGKFRVMYWAGDAAIPSQPEGDLWERPPIDVKLGDEEELRTIELRTYLHTTHKVFVMEVWQGTDWLESIAAPLTDDAFNEFIRGCKVHRELTMATNYKDYLPSVAYFDDTTFSRSTLTTTDYRYVPLSLNNSQMGDLGTDDGDHEDFHKELMDYGTEVDNQGFVADWGWCDFRKYNKSK